MNTTFEQSKQFELTDEEIEYLNSFIQTVLNATDILSASTLSLNRESDLQKIAETIRVSKEERRWFFGRALMTALSSITKTYSQDGTIFTKKLPDRSEITFKQDVLEKTLYDLGRFYLARTFDHSYESLRDISKSWVVLDEYVKERQQTLKIKKMLKKLPELEGIF